MDNIVKSPELSADIGDERVYILDTETASLQGGVVEIAWLQVDQALNIHEEWVCYVNPEREIDPGAQAIHGITADMVKDAPTLQQVAEFKWINGTPINMIAHNLPFDKRMIQPTILVGRGLCTLDLARQFLPEQEKHKLEFLQASLSLPKQKSHSALGDVHTVLDLLKHILPITGVDLRTLFERAAQPRLLAKMPWGMHKGKTPLRLPREYREWLLAQSDIGRDLRYTLERIKNI